MTRMKSSIICMLAALLAVMQPACAFAATGTKITSISLKISSDIVAGDSSSDVTVSSSSSRYDVDEVEVTNEPDDEWEDGDKPKLEVTLIADDDYYFPSSGLTKSDVSLSGDDGTVTSVKRSDSETLLVYITLDALDDDDDDDDDDDSDYDLDVSGLEWDETDGTASWDECDDAKRYEVRVYRGSSSLCSAISTTNTYYDFSSYFTKSGTYTFQVRAVYNSSNKGSWEESDEWYVTSSEAADIYDNSSSSSSSSDSSGSTSGPGVSSSSDGAWLQDSVGWWYCNADKSYTTSDWQYINDVWYYFDASGYMMTGWINVNEIWYYLADSGAMLHDTTTPDGYYVGSDGAWIQ